MKYAEEQVREAIVAAGHKYAEERIMEKLKNKVYVFAGTDAITVKELREALKRMFPADCCMRCGSKFHGNDDPADSILENIHEHREPDYPYASVWKSRNGIYWFRASGKQWMKFGDSMLFEDDFPKRPLTRMEEVPF